MRSKRRHLPQQPLVVTLTTFTEYDLRRSTFHQGLGSLWVSVHLFPSCSVLESPSFPWLASPPRTVVDWLVGLRKATFVPATTRISANTTRWLTRTESSELKKKGRERVNERVEANRCRVNCLEPNKAERRCHQLQSRNKTSITGRMRLVIKRNDYPAS